MIIGKTTPAAAAVPDRPLKIVVEPAASGGYRLQVQDRSAIALSAEAPRQSLLVLARKVQQALETLGPVPVDLYYDDAVPWDIVVKVYDVLYGLGLRNITLRIEE